MTQLILAIDDNKNAVRLLKEFLSDQEFSVVTAANGREALDVMRVTPPNLILLDIMMPTMDGFQFISTVRRTNDVPIIMLTARREEENIVRGFELGADDYMTKPFRMRELLMRVRAVLRRSAKSASAETAALAVGNFKLDKSRLVVTIKEKIVVLTPAEFCLLEKLSQSANIPVQRAVLSVHLIQHNFSGSENTLKTHIRNLRQKLEPDPIKPRYIETVFGVGYRLKTDEKVTS